MRAALLYQRIMLAKQTILIYIHIFFFLNQIGDSLPCFDYHNFPWDRAKSSQLIRFAGRDKLITIVFRVYSVAYNFVHPKCGKFHFSLKFYNQHNNKTYIKILIKIMHRFYVIWKASLNVEK